ncbi:MAG TPA: hypothetical protein VKI19_03105 [Acidimicrobiales bacterium]|nr:hypothetical protein [Acidimicrobiales bacterium]
MVAAAVLLAAATGCGVATHVSVSADRSGHGSVAVSVSLDAAAVDTVGGLARLRSEVAVDDLRRAGWTVTGPAAMGSGGAQVTATHPFGSFAEAGQLLAQVAGPGRFNLVMTAHHTFWRTSYRLTGDVDLRCGIDCFGDQALKAATGSTVGVDPGALSSAGSAAHVFTFVLDATLPGHVKTTEGATRRGPVLEWDPVLGRQMPLAAASEVVNEQSIVAVAAGGAVLLIAAAAGLWFGLLRRARGRHRRRRRWPWRRDRPAPP